MAKKSSNFICQSCGAVHSRWMGKCESCGEWNSIVEEIVDSGAPKGLGPVTGSKKGRSLELVDLKYREGMKPPRHTSDFAEFDRVAGGGLVPGSAILIGGDPGIGKSTLLLQIVASLGKRGRSCLYVSGEEAIDQIRLRAERLDLSDAPVALASATNVRDIITTLEDREVKIDVLVIDSIQTMYVDTVDSAPGTVTQVRTCAAELVRVAKKHDIAIFLVGHVTKEGQIAGPRVLEHLVDTVLYFEGDRGHQFRILRAVKNRFGPTNEIGVFEMVHAGLAEVTNPSALFLEQRQGHVPGSAVLAALEGTRPILVEVQALVAPTSFSAPKRTVIGWDAGRLSMIVAVLEARCGLQFSNNDIYLNIAGGIRIGEPAADLAVAAALISALTGRPVPAEMVLFGEIGLAGEIRQVAQPDLRLRESGKLGFSAAVFPAPSRKKDKKGPALDSAGLDVHPLRYAQDLVDLIREGGIAKNA